MRTCKQCGKATTLRVHGFCPSCFLSRPPKLRYRENGLVVSLWR